MALAGHPSKSLLGRRRWCRGPTGERAEQAAEDASIGVCCDRQVDRVRVDDEPEQVEMDRPEREVEDVTDARRGNRVWRRAVSASNVDRDARAACRKAALRQGPVHL